MALNPLATTTLYNNAPAAWLYAIDDSYAATDLIDTNMKYMFDSAGDQDFQILRPEAVANAEEFVQITRADGAIIEFPKTTIKMDGVSGAQKSGSASSAGKGNIVLTLNGLPITGYTGTAPNDLPTYVTNYKTYIDNIMSNLGKEFLCIIPLGYTYDGWSKRHSTGKTVAFGAIIGVLGADPSFKAASFAPTPIPLTINGRQIKAGDLDAAATKLATLAIPKIRVFEGDTASTQVYELDPGAINSGNAAKLVRGEPVTLANA